MKSLFIIVTLTSLFVLTSCGQSSAPTPVTRPAPPEVRVDTQSGTTKTILRGADRGSLTQDIPQSSETGIHTSDPVSTTITGTAAPSRR